jgi:uncharacterized membrane protein YgcG
LYHRDEIDNLPKSSLFALLAPIYHQFSALSNAVHSPPHLPHPFLILFIFIIVFFWFASARPWLARTSSIQSPILLQQALLLHIRRPSQCHLAIDMIVIGRVVLPKHDHRQYKKQIRASKDAHLTRRRRPRRLSFEPKSSSSVQCDLGNSSSDVQHSTSHSATHRRPETDQTRLPLTTIFTVAYSPFLSLHPELIMSISFDFDRRRFGALMLVLVLIAGLHWPVDGGSKQRNGVIVINNSGGGHGSTNTIVKSNGGKKGKKGGSHDIILQSGGGGGHKCGGCGCHQHHKSHHKVKHIPIPIMMHHHGWKSHGWW